MRFAGGVGVLAAIEAVQLVVEDAAKFDAQRPGAGLKRFAEAHFRQPVVAAGIGERCAFLIEHGFFLSPETFANAKDSACDEKPDYCNRPRGASVTASVVAVTP